MKTLKDELTEMKEFYERLRDNQTKRAEDAEGERKTCLNECACFNRGRAAAIGEVMQLLGLEQGGSGYED